MKRTIITSILAIVIGMAAAEAQPYFRHGHGSGPRRPQHETYYRGDNGYHSSFVPYKGSWNWVMLPELATIVPTDSIYSPPTDCR